MSPGELCKILKGCRRMGVTLDQYALLLVLDDLEEVPCSELCQALGCTTASITGRLDRLEDAQLLTRLRTRQDRRQVRVRVTPLGRNTLNEVERGAA